MKPFRTAAILILFLICRKYSFAQESFDSLKRGKNDTIRVALTKIDNELIPWVPLQDVFIYDTRIYKTPADRAKFYRLRYNVLKVLPYARFARDRYAQLQRDLTTTKNKREQKKLVKACEKEIKDMFNREIKNMTITQGQILIKLIDRETGTSSFEMVKELKGGFTAFFYQSVARVFGHNLKNEYDPEQERDIENIIQSTGYYRYN